MGLQSSSMAEMKNKPKFQVISSCNSNDPPINRLLPPPFPSSLLSISRCPFPTHLGSALQRKKIKKKIRRVVSFLFLAFLVVRYLLPLLVFAPICFSPTYFPVRKRQKFSLEILFICGFSSKSVSRFEFFITAGRGTWFCD